MILMMIYEFVLEAQPRLHIKHPQRDTSQVKNEAKSEKRCDERKHHIVYDRKGDFVLW